LLANGTIEMRRSNVSLMFPINNTEGTDLRFEQPRDWNTPGEEAYQVFSSRAGRAGGGRITTSKTIYQHCGRGNRVMRPYF
jgi:hypothetical protein